jgi:hypothetical protein
MQSTPHDLPTIDDAASVQQTVEIAEIVLDSEVFGAICRRGRRRLRDIQATSQAACKLDRHRGVLQVTGTPTAIADVRRQLECLSGPCLDVTTALWAELMRTRTNSDPSFAAVARLQQQSGCRIHIERNIEQVRLFGPKPKIAIAQQLLEELEGMCIEEAVNMTMPLELDLQMLQTFAREFGVTLHIEENNINVLGIRDAVTDAAKELRNYNSNQQFQFGRHSDVARMAITSAMSKLVGDESIAESWAPPDLQTEGSSEDLMQGAVISKAAPIVPKDAPKKPPRKPARVQSQTAQTMPITMQHMQKMQMKAPDANSFDICPTCGSAGNFCVNCGKPTAKMLACPLAGCPTCHSVKFCVYCGHPTERKMNNMGAMSPTSNEPPSPSYKQPGMYRADQVPMMPMQFVQANNMQMSNSQMSNPQRYMQEGMMTMFVPVSGPFQQGAPMQQSSPQMPVQSAPMGGLHMASNMMTSAANGIQACMVPWAFGSME